MPGLTAPARRLALYLGDDSAGVLNSSGLNLVDAAIKWARGWRLAQRQYSEFACGAGRSERYRASRLGALGPEWTKHVRSRACRHNSKNPEIIRRCLVFTG